MPQVVAEQINPTTGHDMLSRRVNNKAYPYPPSTSS